MIGRRTALTAFTAVGALVLAACGSGLDNGGNAGQSNSVGSGVIKVGYVSPQTGALAPFGEADTYVINQMTQYFKDHPLQIGGTVYQVQVILKDAASDSKRAGEVAADLINNSGVDLILAWVQRRLTPRALRTPRRGSASSPASVVGPDIASPATGGTA